MFLGADSEFLLTIYTCIQYIHAYNIYIYIYCIFVGRHDDVVGYTDAYVQFYIFLPCGFLDSHPCYKPVLMSYYGLWIYYQPDQKIMVNVLQNLSLTHPRTPTSTVYSVA